MPQDDNMQVGVFYHRASNPGQGAIPIQLGGGEGNLVEMWACHWNFELVDAGPATVVFLGVALSSNPEHEDTPLENFQDFQSNKALYGRALIVADHDGIGDSTIVIPQQVIPTYGLIRPRRQIMVWALVMPEIEVMGLGLEVYYIPSGAPFIEREEVNRKFGKYRRT